MPPIFLKSRKKQVLFCGFCPVYFHACFVQCSHRVLEVNAMTARERILAIRLLEKQERSPEYAKRIGIQVKITQKDPNNKEDKHV